MSTGHWKTTAEFVGIAAIVGSLIFVGLQMRQAELLARIEIGTAALGSAQEMRSSIVDHAPIWRKGNAGEMLDPDEMAAYEQLVWSRWQQAVWTDWSFDRLGSANYVGANLFAGFLFDNPGARRTWQSLITRRTELEMKLIEGTGQRAGVENVMAALEKLDALYK
jgi:hypothetical protein